MIRQFISIYFAENPKNMYGSTIVSVCLLSTFKYSSNRHILERITEQKEL